MTDCRGYEDYPAAGSPADKKIGGKMKKLWLALLISALIVVTGCATSGGQNEWYTAQKDYMLAQQTLPQRPLFEMKALPGKSVENLESLTVYAPIPAPAKELKQFVETPHPIYGLAGKITDALARISGLYFLKEGAESIVDGFAKIASIPTSSYTQNISGSQNSAQLRTMGDMSTGDIGNGNNVAGLLDQVSEPTVVDPLVVNPVIVTQPEPVIVDPVIVP